MKLPTEKLTGEKIYLLPTEATLWLLIKELNEDERKFITEAFGWESRHGDLLANEKAFESFVAISNNARNLIGRYQGWIKNRNEEPSAERLVGSLIASPSKADPSRVIIGCLTLLEHREQGYAADALRTFSDFILDNNPGITLCLECKPIETESIRLLRRSGFEHANNGDAVPSLQFPEVGVLRFERKLAAPAP